MQLSIFDMRKGEWNAAAAVSVLREAGAFMVRGVLGPEEILLARRQVLENVEAAGKPISLGRTLPDAAILSHSGQLPDVMKNAIKAASRLRSKADRHDPRWAKNLRSVYSRLRDVVSGFRCSSPTAT